MRNRLTTVTAALLVASASFAWAQGQPATPAATTPSLGKIDLAPRITSTTGDEARYERYRDLRDGVYASVVFGKETDDYLADFKADNIGYRDQKYVLNYKRSKLKFNFMWDSIPLNYSYMTLTPWREESPNVWTLDNAVQGQVQGPTNAANDGTVVGVLCAPGGPPPYPASCSTNVQAQQVLQYRSAYNPLANPFDLQQRRDTVGFDAKYDATEDVGVNVAFYSTNKTGYQPWGASFAFGNANEVPYHLDQRTNDFSAGVEFAREKGMFRFGWDGSWFGNDLETLTWENPVRLTDFTNGLTPPSGPYDPNGYSNANGPARGLMTLPPPNSQNVFSFTGLYRLPKRTSVNGTFQYTKQDQNATLIPWTTNPVINTPTVYAAFPHLARLPRNTAEAGATGLNFLLNLNSRPMRNVAFNVRYRYNERDVTTPEFDATEYVRFDAVPEEIGGPTHQYDTKRQTFDANVTYSFTGIGSLRAGYGHDGYERHGRGFADTGEHIFRLSFDTLQTRYMSLRFAYDYGQRRGEGFEETGVDYEQGAGGTQPTLRYYDEADRNRTRASVLLTVMPIELMDFYVQFAIGQDEYLIGEDAPVSRPDELFGLQNADTTAWNAGLNVRPNDTVNFGLNFGRDEYSTLQQSRNANPPCSTNVPPCAPGSYDQWADPTRNWTMDNDETVNNFSVYLDLVKAIKNTDIKVGYDFSDSDNAFVHGGPRITALATNTAGDPRDGRPCGTSPVSSCFEAMPNVTNQWNRLSLDATYYFRPAVGVGFTYWYEKFEVTDFATVDSNGPVGFTAATGTPRIDYLGGLILGYGNRPYEGNTGFVRLVYLF